jgi:hypothetical protein
MKRKKTTEMPKAAPEAPPEEEILKQEPKRRVLERPDGFYWQAVESGEEYGPFVTLAEAEADMLAGGETGGVEAADLQEAESEIGVSEWIDPETGGPAEDSVPRIEDH